MPNPIHPYAAAGLDLYRPVSAPPQVRPAQAAAQAEADRAAAGAAPAPAAQGLSADEQHMIDRYFPPAPGLLLKLYGPGRGAHTVNPGAVGTRLDLRG